MIKLPSFPIYKDRKQLETAREKGVTIYHENETMVGLLECHANLRVVPSSIESTMTLFPADAKMLICRKRLNITKMLQRPLTENRCWVFRINYSCFCIVPLILECRHFFFMQIANKSVMQHRLNSN